MTPATFRRIRTERIKLDQADLAALLRIEDRRTISRYECGKRSISGPVSLLMEHMDMYGLGYLPTSEQQ
jgi:transcriptional regulator with XRE-family HTH domain